MSPTQKTHKPGRGLMAIAAYKIFKGLALLAVGFGVLHFLHRDLATEIAGWVDFLRIDPHNHYLQRFLEKVAKVDQKKLRELGVGTFIYAALFLTEGTGLALHKRWAEYLTIISTASLMPIEALEIYKHVSIAKVVLLIANIAIVAYLVLQLRSGKAKSG
jgi:uncharacterized membrane protein (DUF2068 family)